MLSDKKLEWNHQLELSADELLVLITNVPYVGREQLLVISQCFFIVCAVLCKNK